MHDEHEHHHHHESNSIDIPIERQAVCPVTGDMVDMQAAEAAGHSRDYRGEKYYFCCATCTQLFDKNPEKYATHQVSSATTLTLKEKEHLVDNVWAFRFTPSAPLTWTAGQFIRVEQPHDTPDAEGTKRWFTISSAPYEKIVQITTRVTESTFKRALSSLTLGGKLQLLEQPEGDFVWEDSDKPLIFVAGGIGITPFRSMLKQRANDSLPLDVTLIYGNRTDAIVFKDELDNYVAKDSKFTVRYVTGEPVTAAKLIELAPSLRSSLVYVSGPEPMVEALGGQLKAAGLPEVQLRQDFFPNYTEANY
jgi:ferredoxin-NADP reductase/YHS domain-containing protein